MPIYEYTCPQCRKNFEEWLKSDDDASTHPCPVCGTASPRIISNTTFILKGGGWYVTEYGSHHAETEAASHEGGHGEKKSAPESTPAGNASEKTPEASKAEPAATAAGSPAAAPAAAESTSVPSSGQAASSKSASAADA